MLHKRKIISKGFNSTKTHPRVYNTTKALHAECSCLLNAAKGDTLVVVRIKKDGSLACSKPCEDCLQFAKEFGIKKIYYIDWDANIQVMKI